MSSVSTTWCRRQLITLTVEKPHNHAASRSERRGRDLNPSTDGTARNGFRDRRIRPLCHPSRGSEARGGPLFTGGEGGIRTLDARIHAHNALAGRRLQPLGHFSGIDMVSHVGGDRLDGRQSWIAGDQLVARTLHGARLPMLTSKPASRGKSTLSPGSTTATSGPTAATIAAAARASPRSRGRSARSAAPTRRAARRRGSRRAARASRLSIGWPVQHVFTILAACASAARRPRDEPRQAVLPRARADEGRPRRVLRRTSPSCALPHLRRRPFHMKRFPNGVDGEFFHQKRVPANHPDFVDEVFVAVPKRATGPCSRSSTTQPALRIDQRTCACVELCASHFGALQKIELTGTC